MSTPAPCSLRILPAMLATVLLSIGCSGDPPSPATGPASPATGPDLGEQLQAKQAAFRQNASADMQRVFDEGVQTVAEDQVMQTALREGAAAPSFTLPNAAGQDVSLADLRADGPVVLVWYRGGWCPYCNIQLQAWQQWIPRLRAAGGQLVAISPELPDKARQTAAKGELDFEVLSDVGNRVGKQFGIVYTLPAPVAEKFQGRIDLAAYNGDESQELPLAVTYVVDRDGVIRYAFVEPDYRKRAEPAEVIEVVEALE